MEGFIATIYKKEDLEEGVCECCGDETDLILIGTNKCIDCIEEQKSYEEIMKLSDENYKD